MRPPGRFVRFGRYDAPMATPGTDIPHSERPFLVTGLPRSGTSWIGRRLAVAPGVRYRYEPFNLHWVPALRGRLGHFRYQRPDSRGPLRLREAADRALSGRQSWKQLSRAVMRGYATSALRREGRLVIKDPTACLLAGWLRRRWDCQVVVLVRHPCGFASSVQALEWPIRLRRLLDQEQLMADHLGPWASLMERCTSDPWTALGAFWSATHVVLHAQADAAWSFLSYENFCLEPEQSFARLSRLLGQTVPELGAGGPHRADPGSTEKDSARMADIWRERLSDGQVASVMEVVETFGLATFPADPAQASA